MNVRVETDGMVTEIVLDRPDQRNALTPAMLDALIAAIRGVETGAALVWGEGRAFCAGFDLELCVKDPTALPALLTGLDRAIRAMRECDAPVVIAAHGGAIAGGCALLAGADVVVADVEAKLGYPVTRLGISPAVSAPTLASAIGPGRARTRLLEPVLFSSVQALHERLVHELVPEKGDVLPLARDLATELASKPRAGIRATKRWLREIESRTSALGAEGLEASLSLVGGDEQVRLLTQAWEKRADQKR